MTVVYIVISVSSSVGASEILIGEPRSPEGITVFDVINVEMRTGRPLTVVKTLYSTVSCVEHATCRFQKNSGIHADAVIVNRQPRMLKTPLIMQSTIPVVNGSKLALS